MAVQRSQTRLSLRAFCLACSHLPRVWRSRAGGSSHRFPGAVGPRRPTEVPHPSRQLVSDVGRALERLGSSAPICIAVA